MAAQCPPERHREWLGALRNGAAIGRAGPSGTAPRMAAGALRNGAEIGRTGGYRNGAANGRA
jgi:hypothetical protein